MKTRVFILLLCSVLNIPGIFAWDLQCDRVNEDQIRCSDGELFTIGDHLDQPMTPRFWIDISIVATLVLVAGLMSGLTMGLMSMDTLNLNIIKNSGEEKDRKHAARILPLVEKHHLLLVTLLLTNAAAAEALPVFLDRLVHPAVAVAISVSLVLLFGEIIPQAVCTRYGLKVGSYLAWFVWLLIGLLFVVAWPIAKLLDLVLGKETGTFFRRTELKELVNLHVAENSNGESLSNDEVRIIKGAIDMKEKTVGECQTPVDEVFAISIDTKLDREELRKIVDAGHYRIPVYHTSRDHFIGMILTKDLILLDPDDATPVRNLKLYKVPMITDDMPLYDMLHQFQTGRSHMAIVLDSKNHINPTGIITLEDVLEELLQEEILDEEDLRKTLEQKEIRRDIKIAKAFHRKYSLVPEALRRGSVAVIDNPDANMRRSTSVVGNLNKTVAFDKALTIGRTSPTDKTSPQHKKSVTIQPPQPWTMAAATPPLYQPPIYTTPSLANEKTPILKKSTGAGHAGI